MAWDREEDSLRSVLSLERRAKAAASAARAPDVHLPVLALETSDLRALGQQIEAPVAAAASADQLVAQHPHVGPAHARGAPEDVGRQPVQHAAGGVRLARARLPEEQQRGAPARRRLPQQGPGGRLVDRVVARVLPEHVVQAEA